MRTLLSLLAPLLILASGASALTDDPYVWLEDVHGAKPLAWVAGENAKALAPLKADPRYQKNYDSLMQVLDATDRIHTGGLSHGFVYNFLQDAANPMWVWRRTSIADYQTADPKWDMMLYV